MIFILFHLGCTCPTLPLFKQILQSILRYVSDQYLHIFVFAYQVSSTSLQFYPFRLFFFPALQVKRRLQTFHRNEASAFVFALTVFIYSLAGKLVSRDKLWVDWKHKSAVAIKSYNGNLFIIQYLVILLGPSSLAPSTTGCVNYLCNLCRLSYWKFSRISLQAQVKPNLALSNFYELGSIDFEPISLAFRHKIFSRSWTKAGRMKRKEKISLRRLFMMVREA